MLQDPPAEIAASERNSPFPAKGQPITITGGFSAEYGKATGGVVNAITKSGTNAFHGDVYEFIRNSALDSRDYFSRSGDTPVAQFRRNQFGAAAGGPIIKDKTFIFGDYEGMRQ